MSNATLEQLDRLVELQDVDCLIRELRDPEMSSHEEKLGFAVEGITGLERTRARLASQVEGRLLQVYERISRRIVRVIVPVDGSVCSGCRINLPTSTMGRNSEGATYEFCENCGRILYRR
jgi:predicted  nucleic acid-binding Zn-ribbon protein